MKARTCRSQSYSNPGGSNHARNRGLPLAVTEESSRYHDISARKTRLSHLIWYGSVKYRDRRSLTCHPCNSTGQLPFSAEAMCSVQLLDCAPSHNEACPLYAVCLPTHQNHAMVVCMERHGETMTVTRSPAHRPQCNSRESLGKGSRW